ncbi:MAG: putative zinc-binding peptidase [Gemmataceae bacterium]|nr:putative zinc-binding peptidase [Gemmataceae bacterium]
MKVFHCDHCDHLVFFESVQCVSCKHALAYLPDLGVTGSLDLDGETWRSPLKRAEGKRYRLCRNYSEHQVCNWAMPADQEDPYCLSCRLTRVIPNLATAGAQAAWYKVETAKRRLIYSLLNLKLPIESKIDEPERGLAFEFLADPADSAAPKVLTGHADGVITLNIAEADDAEREKRKHDLHEPFRTLLGHFRHEVGHYYWDRLIRDSDRIEEFRKLFGDDREDYSASLARHYQEGPPLDWQSQFISAYASMHPWEDWAETWAHYLHMTDALETATTCGLTLRPKRPGEPTLKPVPNVIAREPTAFEAMIESWHALTYVLNNLNRGLGLQDGYPFVLSSPVLEKLRFVHETVTA